MLTILIFVVILGLLVFVHELGHFVIARRNGIKADEFGFGFPPRLAGFVKDDATGRYRFIWGGREVESKNTIYSLNWIPLGGFVRIKGEDPTLSDAHDPDSFAGKSAWVRFKVLVAGVVMNFILAWAFLSIVLTMGFPQEIRSADVGRYPSARIQIVEVAKGSPAESMGLLAGDVVLRVSGIPMKTLSEVSETIATHKGEKIEMTVQRGASTLTFQGIPRAVVPAGEGPLGISFSQTAIISYPWYEAIVEGLIRTYTFTTEILKAFGSLLAGLFTDTKQQLDVAGPIGIVYLTKQVSELGFVYILQFTAVLSINLGIINVLPIPALDGGRILFVLIEKIKGSPVSRRLETKIHQIGFALLLLLMLFVTLHDFLQYNLFGKLQSFF